jgi:hypothetical protein
MKVHIHRKDEDGTLCGLRIFEGDDVKKYGNTKDVTCKLCLRLVANDELDIEYHKKKHPWCNGCGNTTTWRTPWQYKWKGMTFRYHSCNCAINSLRGSIQDERTRMKKELIDIRKNEKVIKRLTLIRRAKINPKTIKQDGERDDKIRNEIR